MYSQNNILDFSSQEFFIGIDVHQKQWVVSIISGKIILKTFSMNPDPKELYNYMQRTYPQGKYNSVYEAGFSGYWAHRELIKYGFNNLVVSPSEIPTSGKEKLSKTDIVDSKKLARELEKGYLKGIYIPNLLQQELRSLCRLRYQQIKSQTRLKNQIKGYLSFYGHKIPSCLPSQNWSRGFIEKIKTFPFEYEIGKEQLTVYIEELLKKREQIVQTTKSLKKYCKEFNLMSDILLLCSVPGIGFISAATLYTELIDINRFQNFDELASYAGLVPSVRGTGDKESVLGLKLQCNKYLRPILIEAAWIAVRKDPALTLSYNNYLKRMSKQEAVVRIAKKLLSRINYVWKHKKQYVNSVVK